MNETKGRDFSIGFVLFVATLVVIVSLFIVGDGGGLLTDQREHKILVPSASGLKVGSRVFLSGVAVGHVKRIDFLEDTTVGKVEVVLSINKRHAARIGSGSKAWLKNEGLLGDRSVHISLGADGKELAAGSEITYQPRALLEELVGPGTTETTTDFLDTLTAILKEIHSGDGSLGKLLKDPELYENLNSFTQSLQGVTTEVKKVSGEVQQMLAAIRREQGTLGKLIYSEDYAANIASALGDAQRLIGNLESITGKVASGEGSLGKLVTDAKLYDGVYETLESLSKTAWRVEAMLTALEDSKSVAGRILSDEHLGGEFRDLVTNLQSSSESLEAILEMVEQGEGTVGHLVHDPSIARSLQNVLLGVSESGALRNVVRRAEAVGASLYIAGLDDSQERELKKVRSQLTESSDSPETPPQSVDESKSEPVPSVGPDGASDTTP